MKKQFRLTQAGLDELKAEMKSLMGQRLEVADKIKQARQLGDLAENAEYQSAREEQEKLETRISEVDFILQNSQLIKKPKADGIVRLGSVVTIKDGGAPKEFQVVGTMEADPLSGKVSDESPIGQELLGKKVGDEIKINSKAYKITDIS